MIIQIGLLDIVFSFDSVLTAIGMTHELVIMIIAVIISMVIMLVFAKPIAEFIERHMSLQILALAFLIMIGTVLIAESAHVEIPKPFVYSSVGFALVVQLLSIRAAERNKKWLLESTHESEVILKNFKICFFIALCAIK